MMKLTKEKIEMMSSPILKTDVQVLLEPIPEDEMFVEEISTIFYRAEKEFNFSKSQLFQAKSPNPLLMYLYNLDTNAVANMVLFPVLGLCLAALVVFPGPGTSGSPTPVETGGAVPETTSRKPPVSFPKAERGTDLPSGFINFSKLPK